VNEAVKAKWLAALRSDREQTRGALRRLNQMGPAPVGECCLGVLCSVAIEEGIDVVINTDGSGVVSYDGESTYPPEKVMEWAGLDEYNPRIKGAVELEGERRRSTSLAILNDDGYDFYKIAYLIEKYL
jgi:hypothetical protein